MHPLTNHSEPKPTGVSSPSLSLMSVQAAPSATPHLSSDPSLTQTTSTSLPSTNILPINNFTPQVQSINTHAAPSIPHFQCHHVDCRRVFARKTSLTNHLKAHNNIKSRSIRRMRRERERNRGTNLASVSASNSASSSPLRPPLPHNVTTHSTPQNNGKPPIYGMPSTTVPLMTSSLQPPQQTSSRCAQSSPVSTAPLPSQLVALQPSSPPEYVLNSSQAEASLYNATVPRIAPPELTPSNTFSDEHSSWAVPFPSPTAAAEDLGLNFASPRTFATDTCPAAFDIFFNDPVGLHTITSSGIDTGAVSAAVSTSVPLPLSPTSATLPTWHTLPHSLAAQRALAPYHVVPNDVQNLLYPNPYQPMSEETRKASDNLHNEAQQLEGAISSGNASTEGTPLTPTGVLGTGTNGETLPTQLRSAGKTPTSHNPVGLSDVPSPRCSGKYSIEDVARNPGYTSCSDGDLFGGFETMPDIDFE